MLKMGAVWSLVLSFLRFVCAVDAQCLSGRPPALPACPAAPRTSSGRGVLPIQLLAREPSASARPPPVLWLMGQGRRRYGMGTRGDRTHLLVLSKEMLGNPSQASRLNQDRSHVERSTVGEQPCCVGPWGAFHLLQRRGIFPDQACRVGWRWPHGRCYEEKDQVCTVLCAWHQDLGAFSM